MKILVISPHPDDETLGAGGTIIRAKKKGHEVYWLNITGICQEAKYQESAILKRNEEIEQIISFYKFNDVLNLKLPTTKLDKIPDNIGIQQISEYILKIRPQILLIPDYNDAHSDHRIVFQWVHACTKTFRYPFIKSVLTMEILSETNFGLPQNPFVPNVLIDISEFLEDKIEAFSIYESEIGIHPFPRSIESIKALACIRGAETGVKYAEGFRMIKMIV